jgi:hypothetical protein
MNMDKRSGIITFEQAFGRHVGRRNTGSVETHEVEVSGGL